MKRVPLFSYRSSGSVIPSLPGSVTEFISLLPAPILRSYALHVFAAVALTVRGSEVAQSAGFVVTFPLVFASSVFVPVSSMPEWLQTFAKVSPVTLTADSARSLTLRHGVPGSLGGAIAWIAGLLI